MLVRNSTRPPQVQLGTLAPGDAFVDMDEELSLRTDESDGDDVMCVTLKTGQTWFAEADTMVWPVPTAEIVWDG